MAKKSMIAREVKRAKLVEKHREKRTALMAIFNNPESSYEDSVKARKAFKRIPVDSCPVRRHNRCALTGRPHGYYRKFGLSRNMLREAAMRGDIPGLTKASW